MHPLIVKAAAKVAANAAKDKKSRRRLITIGALIFTLILTVQFGPLIAMALFVTSATTALTTSEDEAAGQGNDNECTSSIASIAYDGTNIDSLGPEQNRNAATIVGVTKQLGYGKDAAIIAIMVAKREAQLYNIQNNKYDGSKKAKHDKVPADMAWLEKGDHDSGGLFQQRQMYYKDWNKIQDPAEATKAFLKGGPPGIVNYLDAVKGWEGMPKGVVAQKVQGSAVPTGYIPEEVFSTQLVNKLWGTVKESGGGSSDSASAQPVSADSGCGSVAISGSAQDLLKSWTYPTYKYGRLEQTPGYAAVITQAKREGFYTGNPGRVPLGDDCGVFVTNLIVRSGWDKNFNYGGKGQAGNTLTQRAWMEKNWQDLGPASKLKESQLKPLDVGIQDGHVWVYTGPVAGKTGTYAEASERSHYGQGFAPQFNNKYGRGGDSVLNAEEPTAHYFRKK